MSKKYKKLAHKQCTFDFSFEKRVQAHLKEKSEILETIHNTEPAKTIESYEEACIEQAAAIKKAVRDSGMSREEVVDRINEYFGWTANNKGKHLSIHMFNHHLSKPAQYPIPAPLLYAIHHVTGSLAPCRSFAEAEDGDVITQDEKKELMLGKMETAVYEMQRLKRELRGKTRKK
ncbi:MAG: hypothetical protein SV775_02010 [Thermodesulfobacteriota bacterium]|nr:hypothetical protein [Thermodesulfobacteriota bacterium]